jgi:beta-N-acetylhexosaminidase
MVDWRNPGPVTWTGTLVITWLFGILIGLSLGYALFTGKLQAPMQIAEVPEVQESIATPPAPEPKESAPDATETLTAQPAAPETEAAPAKQLDAPPQPQPERRPNPDAWAARHLFIAVNGQWLADGTRTFIRELRPGGVYLRDVNLRSRTQTAVLVDEIKKAVGLGEGLSDLPLIAASLDGGAQAPFEFDNLPNAAVLASTSDEDGAHAWGRRIAAEATARGVSVLIGPTFDVYEPGGAFPDFANRSFGNDPALVTRFGLAMADGIQAGGAVPVVKHFPGYGAATYGNDGLLVMLNKDYNGLAQIIFPFMEAIAAHTPGILVGHVAVPALDRDHPNRSAALSPVLVRELLRTRRGYDGVILADDVALNTMTRSMPIERAVVEALAAGCDAVILLDPDPERIMRACFAIEDAIASDALDSAQLEASRERLERWRKLLGAGMSLPPASTEPERVAEAPAPALPWDSAPLLETTPPTPVESVPEATRPPAEQPESMPKDRAALGSPATEAERTAEASEPVIAEGRVAHVVREGETLDSIAKLHGVTPTQLREWNALDGEPGVGQSLEVVIGAEPVIEMPVETAAEETQPAEASEPELVIPPTGKIFHAVAEGETADAIAKRYNVTKADLLMWNDLDDGPLETGSIVTVFVDVETMMQSNDTDAEPESPEEAPPSEVDGVAEEMEAEAPPADASDSEEAEPGSAAPEIATDIYEVQAGDTLMAIARTHGTTSRVLMELNGIDNANQIFVGQKLKVPAKE